MVVFDVSSMRPGELARAVARMQAARFFLDNPQQPVEAPLPKPTETDDHEG